SRRRHTRLVSDWSSDVCSSDLASGGIRSGLDIAKSISLGADVGAFGQPLLAAALESPEKVIEFIRRIIYEIKVTMLCVGAKNLDALKKTSLTRGSTDSCEAKVGHGR